MLTFKSELSTKTGAIHDEDLAVSFSTTGQENVLEMFELWKKFMACAGYCVHQYELVETKGGSSW